MQQVNLMLFFDASVKRSQHDLHRFVWRENPERSPVEYQMTRLIFGICASSFATKMVMK